MKPIYIAGASIAAAIILATTAYNIGKSVADGEHSETLATALTEQRERLAEQHADSIAALNQDYSDAIARARADAVTTTEVREVIEYVDREIKVPGECDKLAADVIRVQHEASRIIGAAARKPSTR